MLFSVITEMQMSGSEAGPLQRVWLFQRCHTCGILLRSPQGQLRREVGSLLLGAVKVIHFPNHIWHKERRHFLVFVSKLR